MTDYYSVLSRAIAETGSHTPETRATLYQRVQGMLADQFQSNRAQWTVSSMRAELALLEAAIQRLETEFDRKRGTADHARPQAPVRRPDPIRMSEELSPQTKRRTRVPIVLSLLGVVAAILVGMTAYIYWPGSPKKATASNPPAPAPSDQGFVQVGEFGIDTGELVPGVDGGSSESGLLYFNRRQPIYYRTTYSAGMIVIDRSQRFLYLVQPQSIALRYGIGVGGECLRHVGLQRVSKIVEWPEWTPSAELLKRRSYPPRVAGVPGNPLGARVLYFENDALGIHGTNAPKSIGQALSLGCYRMVNDSIVDLAKRIAPGAGVVILN